MGSVDIINEYLMEGDNMNIIYFDFSKAFDTVSHYLLVKMKNLGISKKNSKYCNIPFDR